MTQENGQKKTFFYLIQGFIFLLLIAWSSQLPCVFLAAWTVDSLSHAISNLWLQETPGFLQSKIEWFQRSTWYFLAWIACEMVCNIFWLPVFYRRLLTIGVTCCLGHPLVATWVWSHSQTLVWMQARAPSWGKILFLWWWRLDTPIQFLSRVIALCSITQATQAMHCQLALASLALSWTLFLRRGLLEGYDPTHVLVQTLCSIGASVYLLLMTPSASYGWTALALVAGLEWMGVSWTCVKWICKTQVTSLQELILTLTLARILWSTNTLEPHPALEWIGLLAIPTSSSPLLTLVLTRLAHRTQYHPVHLLCVFLVTWIWRWREIRRCISQDVIRGISWLQMYCSSFSCETRVTEATTMTMTATTEMQQFVSVVEPLIPHHMLETYFVSANDPIHTT